MQQVVFIHGGDSFSDEADFLAYLRTTTLRNPRGEKTPRWTDTLRADLGSAYELYQLSMPNSDNADYQAWSIWFERHFEYWEDGVVLVGWSLGGMFLAKYLSEKIFPLRIKALILLGAPCGHFEDATGNDCGSFQFEVTNLARLSDQVADLSILHSTDDFVVPFTHAEDYKTALPKASLITFTDKNHFLQPTFPELITLIKSL